MMPLRTLASPRAAIPLLLLAGLAAHANGLTVPFQFDDGLTFVENPAVHSLSAFFSSGWDARRWLGFLTFAANGSVGGLAPAGYHAVNLALHLAVALEVFFLARLVAALRRGAASGDAETGGAPADGGLGPLVAALLFVLHPLQTQAVTYVVQRFALLAALFSVAAVLLHGHAVLAAAGGARGRAAALRAGTVVVTLLALLSKQSAATLPAALVLFDHLFCPGTAGARLRRLAPPAAAAAIVVALLLGSTANDLRAVTAQFSRDEAASLPPWLAYLATQPGVLLRYLGLFLLPVGQTLEHDVPVVTALAAPSTLLPAGGLLLLLGVPTALAAVRLRRTGSWPARLVLFAVGWFLVTLAVESSVIPLIDVMVEHRMYLPIAGLAVAIGLAVPWCAWGRLREGGRRALLATLGAALIALGAATWARNLVWQSPERLWTDALEKAPLRPRPYNWLGRLYTTRGEHERAIALLERGRALPRPGFEILVNLGSAYGAAGRMGESEAAYRQALAMPGGDHPITHLAIAQHLLDRGEVRDACVHFLAVAAQAPRLPSARANAAACRLQSGDVAGAVRDWRALLADDPADVESAFNLAGALERIGDREGAAAAYRHFLARADARYAPQRAHAEAWLAGPGGPPPVAPDRTRSP
jgi:Flp pilus assembly protein TadD